MENPSSKDTSELPAEDEEKNNKEDLKKILEDYISELQARLKYKSELRQQNLQCVRPPDSHFSKLDSSLKKNTTFVKKLKTFSASQLDSFLKDFSSLNLTKYISEVASAITEAKLKLSDVQPIVKLCSTLHQTYAEFAQNLFENWQKILTFKVSDKINNASKLRVDLRFYGELVTCGIFTNKMGLPLLGNILTVLINMDKEEHNNINILVTFCKHCGEDYAGLVPKKIKDLAEELKIEVPRSSFLPPEKQGTVRTILMDYYSSLIRHLGTQKQQLQTLHIANQRTLHTRGELSQERKDQLEAQQTSYDRLLTGAQNFAEILGEDLGEVGEPITINSNVLSNNSGDVVIGHIDGEVKLPANDPWQDEDTRSFYTSLPDLKVFLPNYQPSKEANPDVELSEEMLDQELQEEEFNDAEDPINIPEPEQEETQTSNISNKYALEAFLNHLPNCVNREAIDNSAVDFILNLNTKHNRRKLTRVLFSVARTRLDLLPFYARFAAILYPVLPDIGTDLSQMLKQDFKYHVRKKDQINIESKIKVVRFIGEQVKFGLYSKIEALYCLKVLLHDFKHHHIEMACNLLETCGRFLYCSPDTHQRTAIYLQQMMRIKSVSISDSRHITQIENAYYYVNPPESTAVTREEEPPLHRFIKKILHQDLQKVTEDKTLRLMRKVDWDNDALSELVVQWLAAGWKVKHSGRRCLARLVAALASWQEVIGSRVVDAVLEDLRITLEHPHPRHNQRRIAMARYLGELYNYKLVDSRDIFNALYSFITFGVSMEHNVDSPLDPADSAFRIRLVCVLLETCGAYFNSGSSKKKLDYFLIFFQNYYWYKYTDPIWTEENPFPIYISNLYQECLTTLRSKLVQFKTWQECKDAIEDLKKNLYPHLNEEGNMDGEGGVQGDDEGLETIMETDDEGNSDHQLLSNSSDDEDMTETDDGPGGDMESQDTPRVPTVQKQVEDIEFESALEKMMLDNMSERQREGRPTQRDISVPVHCRQQTKKTYEQLLQGNDNVEFVLMVRKGTKQMYKAFDAPAELTSNLKQQALANRLEMEKVKRLTLNITERQEEEDYCGEGGGCSSGGGGSGSGGGGSGNPNRGPHSRQKYQHPKGAPDVDLIFGTKKLK